MHFFKRLHCQLKSGKSDWARQDGNPTKIGSPCDAPGHPFNPSQRRRSSLLARFDNELLSSIQDLNVPILQDVVWLQNSDGELQGGFGYVERALWNDQDIAVKFLKGTQTDSGIVRGKRVGECILAFHKLDS